MPRRSLFVALIAVAAALPLGCSDDDTGAPAPPTTVTSTAVPSSAVPASSVPSSSAPQSPEDQRFPDVIAVDVEQAADGTARFDVTVSSPYDTPDRYADVWRIVGPDGVVYGVRELAHDHANEQPFTRSLDGVAIPDGVAVVTVEARDSANGWGGATVDADL